MRSQAVSTRDMRSLMAMEGRVIGAKIVAKIGPVNRDFHYEPPRRSVPMADLKSQFEQAVAESKSLPEKPDNMTLLKLYALYKQASSGDADGKRPGFTDMVGRAKWDAWNGLAGTSSEQAMTDYVELIESLK
jgi:acyl-CoA-binding protein